PGVDAPGTHEVREHGFQQLLSLVPGVVVQAAQGPLEGAAAGDRIEGGAGVDAAPGEVDAGTRIHATGERGWQLGGDGAERVDQVLGEVGPGSMTAGTAHHDLHRIGGGGDRAGLQPDVADVDARVAVQGEDRVHAVQHVLADQL